MQQREFHDAGELEDVKNGLARATQHPVFTDLGSSYEGRYEHDSDDLDHTDQLRREPDISVIWNERDSRRSYVATDEYELVQHREVMDMIQGALNDTVGEIDFGMVRDWGEKIDGVLVFGNQDEARIDLQDLLGDNYIPPEQQPDTDPTAETSRWRDSVGLGMRFQNSFDGGTKIGGSTMGYRYICQNWMVWNEETIGTVNKAHVGDISSDFFADIIEDVFDTRENVEDAVTASEERELPFDWISGVLENVGFGRNYRKRIAERVDDYEHPDHLDGDHTTMWRLYNAVTAELDHNTVQDSTLNTYNVHQRKAWNILTEEPEEPEEEVPLEELVN